MKRINKVKIDGVIYDYDQITNDGTRLGASVAKHLWEALSDKPCIDGAPTLKAKDITYYSNIIVRAKHGDEEYTTHDIAENEIVTPRTAYGHIQKLVKNGLLTQTSMEGDGVYNVNWKGMYEFCGATFIFEEGEDR